MSENLNKNNENANQNTENSSWDGNDHPGRSGLIMLILCVVGFLLVGMVSNSSKDSSKTQNPSAATASATVAETPETPVSENK